MMAVLRPLALLLAALPPLALAARVELPLRFSLDTVQRTLAPLVVYRSGACRQLVLRDPVLEASGDELRLRGPASGEIGMDVGGSCRALGSWRGSLELSFVPVLDMSGRVRVRVLDSRLTVAEGSQAASLVWEAAKRDIHARLQNLALDVAPARRNLVAFLASLGPQPHAAELAAAIERLELLQPRIRGQALVVPVALQVPDSWRVASAPAASTAPLSESEMEALDRALQPWDAFFGFAIKQLALERDDARVRQRLFTLLLQSRYELAAILSGEVRTAGDPVRALFVDAWTELRAILADGRHGLALDAGDALVALDAAAPGLGVRLTAEGLRQLARSLAPGATADPLAYDWSVDPELGRLFGVVPPEDAPASEPQRRSWLDFFVSRAHAASGRPLDPWVPARGELAAYEARIAELLRASVASEQRRAALAAPYDEAFRHLVPATALIESCWRQYEIRTGRVRYVRSAAASVGIMQINERVWRGFYDVQRLRWDTAYNIRAGTQILLRYLRDYAIPYAEKRGAPEDAPRAAYAVYNAGPRAVARVHRNPPHPREQRVDARLWMLYEGIASGGQADLASCTVISATAAR